MQALKAIEDKVCRGFVLDEHKKWIPLSEKVRKEKEFLKHIESGEILFHGKWLPIAEVKKQKSETETPQSADLPALSEASNQSEEQSPDAIAFQAANNFPPETVYALTEPAEPEPDYPPETIYSDAGIEYPPETALITIEEIGKQNVEKSAAEVQIKGHNSLFRPNDSEIMSETISFDSSMIQAVKEERKPLSPIPTVSDGSGNESVEDWESSRARRNKVFLWGTVITVISAVTAAVLYVVF